MSVTPCPLCGTPCRVEGKTTMHFEPVPLAPEIVAVLRAIAEHDVWYWDDGLDYHPIGSAFDDWIAAGRPGLPKEEK